jgi:uncharacterized phage protein gp47/JayE
MIEIKEFTLPSFLQNQSADEIQENMLSAMPDDIDKSEGGIPYEFTRPPAIEKARMVELTMQEAIKNIVPMWATDLLDYHAECRGMIRKPAEYASVTITVTGTAGTKIESGFKFSTEATASTSGIEFATLNDVTILESGTVDIACKAALPGAQGNVPAGSIILQSLPQSGITSITNAAPSTGGIDQEEDEALRQRILEFDQMQDVSFAGSLSDYKRWAEEVPGVGTANPVTPSDDSGVITIYLLDANGDPATTNLCTTVYNHMMRPDAPISRLAPINDKLSVLPPATVIISVSAKVVLKSGYTITAVQIVFLSLLKSYLKACSSSVLYNQIGSCLLKTDGVTDYSELLVNSGTANVALSNGAMAVTAADKVVLTSV